ncbi:hypothetical protein ACFXEZ_10285, partial [Streptomyces hygroscopicus]
MAAQNATRDNRTAPQRDGGDGVRDREIRIEQAHLDRVYHRLEEKIHEAEFLMDDAAKRGQVGTPGALAERDAQVFRAGVHLNRLNSEFEDFLFGRIDLLPGKDGERGPDGAHTSVEPADDAIRTGPDGDRAEIAETLHIGRIGRRGPPGRPRGVVGGGAPPPPRKPAPPPAPPPGGGPPRGPR